MSKEEVIQSQPEKTVRISRLRKLLAPALAIFAGYVALNFASPPRPVEAQASQPGKPLDLKDLGKDSQSTPEKKKMPVSPGTYVVLRDGVDSLLVKRADGTNAAVMRANNTAFYPVVDEGSVKPGQTDGQVTVDIGDGETGTVDLSDGGVIVKVEKSDSDGQEFTKSSQELTVTKDRTPQVEFPGGDRTEFDLSFQLHLSDLQDGKKVVVYFDSAQVAFDKTGMGVWQTDGSILQFLGQVAWRPDAATGAGDPPIDIEITFKGNQVIIKNNGSLATFVPYRAGDSFAVGMGATAADATQVGQTTIVNSVSLN